MCEECVNNLILGTEAPSVVSQTGACCSWFGGGTTGASGCSGFVAIAIAVVVVIVVVALPFVAGPIPSVLQTLPLFRILRFVGWLWGRAAAAGRVMDLAVFVTFVVNELPVKTVDATFNHDTLGSGVPICKNIVDNGF